MPFIFARCIVLLAALFGCGCRPASALHPVTGSVSYNGKPLAFGTVMFQPPAGSPSSAQIQPDGSFTLEIPGIGRGAVTGPHQIIVLCYENQDPQRAASLTDGEPTLGRPLIPARYSRYETSGLSRVVPAETVVPVILALTD